MLKVCDQLHNLLSFGHIDYIVIGSAILVLSVVPILQYGTNIRVTGEYHNMNFMNSQ